MKKFLAVLGFIFGILLVAAAAIVIWKLPLLKAAKTLSNAENITRFNFDIKFNIDDKELTDEQLKFVNNISGVMNVDPADLLKLRAEGSLYDETATGLIYCDALEKPVTRVFIADNKAYINVKMLYEHMQEGILQKHPILGKLLPDWGYDEYITSEQLETIFKVDFENLFTIKKQDKLNSLGLPQIAAFLFSLNSTKADDGNVIFDTTWLDYDIAFSVKAKEAAVAKEEDKTIFPVVDFSGKSNTANDKIDNFNGNISFDLDKEIKVPESVISEETANGFAELWKFITDLRGRFS